MKKIVLYVSCLFIFACSKTTSEQGTTTQHDEHQHQHATESASTTEPETEVSVNCGNCGMETKDYPKWKAQIVNGDKTNTFCTPRCMFVEYLKDSTSLKASKIQVTDYYKLEPIDAKTAYYVIKSDVVGPMGHDFVPIQEKEGAEQFMKEHQGGQILTFDQVSPQLIEELVKQ